MFLVVVVAGTHWKLCGQRRHCCCSGVRGCKSDLIHFPSSDENHQLTTNEAYGNNFLSIELFRQRPTCNVTPAQSSWSPRQRREWRGWTLQTLSTKKYRIEKYEITKLSTNKHPIKKHYPQRKHNLKTFITKKSKLSNNI